MKHACYLCFLEYLLLLRGLVKVQAMCPYPDFPSNGKIDSHQKQFEIGDEINYSCEKGFVLDGKERRRCKSNGLWSDRTPFCDASVLLSDPIVRGQIGSRMLLEFIDGKNETCFDWSSGENDYLHVHFDKKVIVQRISIFIKKGRKEAKMHIQVGLDNDMVLCNDYHYFVDADRWVEIKCVTNVLANKMKIRMPEFNSISLCEIEIYGKEEDSCNDPPEIIINNGHFMVSRSKAILICKEGYKSGGKNRLVCDESRTWDGNGLGCFATPNSTKVDEVTDISVMQNSTAKVNVITDTGMQNSTAKVNRNTDSGDQKFVTSISVCIPLVVIFLGLTVYYFRQLLLERRKNSTPVREIPPPISTIPSRNWEADDGSIYKDDSNYESIEGGKYDGVRSVRRENSTTVQVTPPPISTIPLRRLDTDGGYVCKDDEYMYKDDGSYQIMK